MMPATTKAGGQCLALPDVCLTPAHPSPPPTGEDAAEAGQPTTGADTPTPQPAPLPYANVAEPNRAKKVSGKVKFVNKEVVTRKSEIPRSTGDEAGADGGIISGQNMQKVTYKRGSSKVMIEGQPCEYLTAATSHNGTNANAPSGAQVSPSQAKVFVSM